MKWFKETLHADWQQHLKQENILYESNSAHQHVIIFENKLFGRVLALDHIVQLTEKDEFIYHEMFAHVPVFAHGQAQHILIIGGGDGGILRELLRHPTIEQIDIVEIDDTVISMCQKFFPMVEQNAFSDSRVKVHIDDGSQFVQKTSHQYDLILVDSTDPIGPAKCLFESAFYQHCLARLKPKGILVTQNGNTFCQLDELQQTYHRFKALTSNYGFYVSVVPTYIGGMMSHAWASNDRMLSDIDPDDLKYRFQQADLEMKYYNPAIHLGAFALPQYVWNAFNQNKH